MNLNEFKLKLIDTGIFRKVNSKGQYRCKECPFCGDAKNHMYVLIRTGDDTPVMYNCFKCNAHGFMNTEFLNYYGIDNLEIPKVKGTRRIANGRNEIGMADLIGEHDGEMIAIAKDYIRYRVGVEPTDSQLKEFQLIGNPDLYIDDFIGGHCNTKGRVWFRMGNGAMIGRSFEKNDNGGMRWKKFTGERSYLENGIYIIKKGVIATLPINVCICEGVMDAIGLYYHSNVSNAVYIACLGRDYTKGMMHAISMGVFGDSVNIRIYKDADVDKVKVKKVYGKMFKRIDVYRNSIGKDFGVHEDCIEIEKCESL